MNKELAKIEDQFPVLSASTGEVAEVIQENFDDGIDPFLLEWIKVPPGGSIMWEREDSDPQKALRGIIVGKLTPRARWESDLSETGGGTPPDCTSVDGKTGIFTDEDGKVKVLQCATCPYNQFGSKGRGKACKEMVWLFLLLEGEILPVIVSVPPTSIKECKKYTRRLTAKLVPYWSAITELTLTKDKSKDGITYSKIQFSMVGKLEGAEKEKMAKYREAFMPAIEAIKSRVQDVMANEHTAEA